MFEMGRVYFSTPGNFDKAGDDKERLPYQEKRIGLVLSGKAGGYFSEAKGIIQGFLNRIFKGYWEVEFVAVDDFPPYSDHEQSVRIRIDSHDLGIVSLINRQISKNFGLKNETVIAEMNFAEILALWSSCPLHKYQPIPKYPAGSRDLAFVVDSRMLYNDLEKEIKNFNPLISRVELFDSYQGGKLGQDRKSLAFHVIYQATDRTLRAEEIDVIQNSLIERLQEKFSAQIRNF
jgi:phenylalanyl-tRNA synthetase beta chain